MCRNSRWLMTASGAVLLTVVAPGLAGAQSRVAPQRMAVRDFAREVACGPRVATTPPVAAIRVVGGEEPSRAQFAAGDRMVINAGSSQGLKTGQEYYVRRLIADRYAPPMADVLQPLSIHTAGWVQLVDVRTDVSIAQVTHACDSISDGDYLEPFALPVVPEPSRGGEADFANPGHLVMGAERRQVGSSGTLMVLDRGSDHGMRPGQQLTIFRTSPGGPILRIAGATTVTVGPETSMVRIDRTSDAVYVGDRVAIHR